MSPTTPAAPATLLDALQQQGAAAREPLRWLHLQALARRAAGWQGPAAAPLQARVAALAQAWVAEVQATGSVAQPLSQPLSPPLASPVAAPSPWARLLADHAQRGARAAAVERAGLDGTPPARAADPGADTAAAGTSPPRKPPPELTALRQFRGRWTQLRVEQRLAQTRAQVPPNAGPLNTLGLVHRMMGLMGEVSPGYLQHFIAHTEALLALQTLLEADLPAPAARPAPKVAPKAAPKTGAASRSRKPR